MCIQYNRTVFSISENCAAEYIGMPREFLRYCRLYGSSKSGVKGPRFICDERLHKIAYLIEDLDDWILENQNNDDLRACVDMSQRALDSATDRFSRDHTKSERSFPSLLKSLENWHRRHRPEFFQQFGDPVEEGDLFRLQLFNHLVLPQEYVAMLEWRNGEGNGSKKFLHPFNGQMFMSIDEVAKCLELPIQIYGSTRTGDTYKSRKLLPFMTDGFDNFTCINLSNSNYGSIINAGPDYGVGVTQFFHLKYWLTNLVGTLKYLDVETWEKVMTI